MTAGDGCTAALLAPGAEIGVTMADGGTRSGPFSEARLTFGDVRSLERWAWRPSVTGEFPAYFFDGVHFWWQPRFCERVMVTTAVVPSHGWRHWATCNCPACRGGRAPERTRS